MVINDPCRLRHLDLNHSTLSCGCGQSTLNSDIDDICTSCLSAPNTICPQVQLGHRNKIEKTVDAVCAPMVDPVAKAFSLAFKRPGSTWLVLLAHKVQEGFHVCLSSACLGHVGHLLQLLQVLLVLCDFSQAFLQSHCGFLLQASMWNAGDRIKVRHCPQGINQPLGLRGLQEVVVAASCVHRCSVGSNGSRTCGDGSNGAGAKGIDIQEVLAVNDNEIDEGNDLANVGHSTTNVDRAECLGDALEHIDG
mmetsp:Transcript_2976/g.3613  ORF Transcript_2976/g.3613 Transcript_2976/m.3613 type:complete len:250 (-) Transcript_2976:550-1299(-)